MLGTHPVAVGKVDADGAAGVEVAAQDGCVDDLGRHAAAQRLLEAGIHRRMVLKPLRVPAQGLCSSGGLVVGIVDVAFPARFQSQRVAIHLGEAIGEIHFALGLLHPQDGVGVEDGQVARLVELDELAYDALLPLVFGIGDGLRQHLHYLPYGCSVHAIGPPHVLVQASVGSPFQPAVHTIHDGMLLVALCLLACVELLGFGLCDAGCIVVACRGEQQVFTCCLVDPLGHDRGVEDDGEKLLFQCLQRTVAQGDVLSTVSLL